MLRADKEAYGREICKGVEHHPWSSVCCPAYRGSCVLRSSKPIPWCIAVTAEGGGLFTHGSKVKAPLASYFERLYQADPLAVELDVRGITILIADPPINCEPHSFLETQVAVNLLNGDKAPGIYGILSEFLKAHGNAVLVS